MTRMNGVQVDGLKQFRLQPPCVGLSDPERRSENACFVFADFVLKAEAVIGELGEINDRALRIWQTQGPTYPTSSFARRSRPRICAMQ